MLPVVRWRCGSEENPSVAGYEGCLWTVCITWRTMISKAAFDEKLTNHMRPKNGIPAIVHPHP